MKSISKTEDLEHEQRLAIKAESARQRDKKKLEKLDRIGAKKLAKIERIRALKKEEKNEKD